MLICMKELIQKVIQTKYIQVLKDVRLVDVKSTESDAHLIHWLLYSLFD